jgi:hypothetical protein
MEKKKVKNKEEEQGYLKKKYEKEHEEEGRK